MIWAALAIIVAAAIGLWLYVQQQAAGFETMIAAQRQTMIADQAESSDPELLLPPIVRQYAEKAGGAVGGPAIVHLRHEATLATAKGQPPISITADQWLGTRHSGMVWHATGRMFGLPVAVIDSFVAGKGMLSARIAGVFEVAGGSGPDFDKGELMRYLSELPVHPDAILNNHALAWRQVDERTVEVSARAGTQQAIVSFGFDDDGDIVSMRAEDRPMAVDGTTRPTPWIGSVANYRQFGRYRIPSYGEVGWLLPDGFFTYWHGTVVAYRPVDADQRPASADPVQ